MMYPRLVRGDLPTIILAVLRWRRRKLSQSLKYRSRDLKQPIPSALLGAAKSGGLILVESAAELAGSAMMNIATAAAAAASGAMDSAVSIPLVNTTQQPALAALRSRRETREKLV
ncbi:hypothetical protein ACNKHO_09805 [Shigella flexneri]